MTNQFKNKLISLIFLNTYLYFYDAGFIFGLKNDFFDNFDNLILVLNILSVIYIINMFKIQNISYKSIFLKIVIFILFLIIYFFTEQLLITLSMYSIGNSGGWIRNNIYEDINYVFQWYEVLFWNFIFSLHYPIYIFIFFKPFVNHLDKSIGKIKNKENE